MQTGAQLGSLEGHFTSLSLSYSPLPLPFPFPFLPTRLISLSSSAEKRPSLGDAQPECYK